MEELIDVIDEEGQPAGRTANRDEIHQNGLWHRSAHIWIINPAGELIIQKRASSKINYPDLWDISAAGHVSAGRSSIETAIAETGEELGLTLPAKKFELLFSLKRQNVLNNGTYIDNEITDVYLVQADFDLSQLKIQEDEVAEIKSIKLADLEKVILSGDKTFVPHPKTYPKLFAELRKRFP